MDAFADAFAAHADEMLTEDDLRPRTIVDAVVSGSELTLELCAELRRLAPFGLGNPGVTLLLPSCELRELATVGDGKHLRFRVHGRDNDSGSAIAFGLGTQLDRFRREGRYDVVFRLEENHWNGTVAPQLVVRRVFDAHEGYESLREWLAAQWRLAECRANAGGESGLRRARAQRRDPREKAAARVGGVPRPARRARARPRRLGTDRAAVTPHGQPAEDGDDGEAPHDCEPHVVVPPACRGRARGPRRPSS